MIEPGSTKVFNNDKSAYVAVEARNDAGVLSLRLSHGKTRVKPGGGDHKFRMDIHWMGRITGQPSVWSETWYWIGDPPYTEERLTATCPDKVLLEEALAELTAKMPEGF